MNNLKYLWSAQATYLAELFAKNNFENRKVGGSVRDGLCNKPSADEDLCTTATPQEMLELGAKLGLRTIPTLDQVLKNSDEWNKGGLKHGTVPFVIDGETYEITTLRNDVETDGRHAKVEFIRSFEQDAARRDFTINAMSIDLDGKLYDYFNGKNDLENGNVRFVGVAQERIREDYLRILRFFRFHARYGNQNYSNYSDAYDLYALNAIQSNKHGLKQISGERIWQEIEKIIKLPTGLNEIKIMKELSVCEQIGLDFSSKGLNLAQQANDNFAEPSLILGLLLSNGDHKIKPEQIRNLWKFSVNELSLTQFAYENSNFDQISFDQCLKVATLANRAKPHYVSALLKAFGRIDEALEIENNLPVFPIQGADLVKLGIKQGPEMGKILNGLHEKWTKSRFKFDKQELLKEFVDSDNNDNLQNYKPNF